MSQQSSHSPASVTFLSPEAHHNKPEEHKETEEKKEEKFDEDISIEEALSTL